MPRDPSNRAGERRDDAQHSAARYLVDKLQDRLGKWRKLEYACLRGRFVRHGASVDRQAGVDVPDPGQYAAA